MDKVARSAEFSASTPPKVTSGYALM